MRKSPLVILLAVMFAQVTGAQLDGGTGAFTGGTLTSKLVCAIEGLEFTETDTITDCSSFSATGGAFFYDDSEGVFKVCQDNVLSTLGGGTPAAISAGNSDCTVTDAGAGDFTCTIDGNEVFTAVDSGGTDVTKWQLSGNITTLGPTMAAIGETNTDGNFAASGTGGFAFSNGGAATFNLNLNGTWTELRTNVDLYLYAGADYMFIDQPSGALKISALGSAAAPSYSFVSCPTCGIYASGTVLGISAAGIEGIRTNYAAGGVNLINITPGTTGNPVSLSCDGDANCGINISPQGTGAIELGGIAQASATSGITASVTQTQGQQQLTSAINEVSTVANSGDVVTMPAAVGGQSVTIINNGANSLQIYPGTSDDLGDGVDTSMLLQANETVLLEDYDATNWQIVSETEIFHAAFEDSANTDAFVVAAANNSECYHTNGLAAGDLAEWTFDAGGGGTSFPIASISDAGAGDVTITTTGSHALAAGAIVSQSNLADAAYEGVFVVQTAPTATTYTVTATWTATDTGTMNECATLTALPSAAGQYSLQAAASATSESNNDIFDFQVRVDAALAGVSFRQKYAIGADSQSHPIAMGTIAISSGSKVSVDIVNTASGGDITLRSLVLVLIRL